MNLNEILSKTIQFFKDKKIESARLDAEILISHVLKIKRIDLYLKFEQPLTKQEISACREVVKRRITGESVAYIIGEKGFFGRDFFCGSGVLVPRPETEMIVEHVLEFIEKNKIENPKILDIGTGTGCIGLSLLLQIPSAKLVAVEKYTDAAKFFLKNCERHGLIDRVDFIQNDFESLKLNDKFDCIVANPPYIDVADSTVQKSVREFEPSTALFAEDQGISLVRSWSIKSKNLLSPLSLMMFEIGSSQGAMADDHFQKVLPTAKTSIIKDLSGLDRFVKAVQNN